MKRQCLNNLPAVPIQVKKQRQYAPTLREQRPGTPRRKFRPSPQECLCVTLNKGKPATRKSLRLSERKSLSPRKSSPQKRSPNKGTANRKAHTLSPIKKKSNKRKSLPAASAYTAPQNTRRSLPLFPGLIGLEGTLEAKQEPRADSDTERSPAQGVGKLVFNSVSAEDIRREQDDSQTYALASESTEGIGIGDSPMGSSHSTPTKTSSSRNFRRLSRSMNDGLLEPTPDFQTTNSPSLAHQNEAEADDSDDLSSLDSDDDHSTLDVPILSVNASIDTVDDETTFEQYLEVAGLSELFRSPEKSKQAVLLHQVSPEETNEYADSSGEPAVDLLSAPEQQPSERTQPAEINEDIDGVRDKTNRKAVGRVSDDTSELLDFLKRVQSKKEAEAKQLMAEIHADSTDANLHESPESPSPSDSPRKALAAVNGNSPSPTGTPLIGASEELVQANDNDDDDELAADVKPSRRSMRALITQRRPKQGTPTIPLRHRPDGTNPVLLQSRASAELALLTRQNTKRNKGQARMPQAMLEILKTKELSPVKERTKKVEVLKKEVDWDETLVYYQEENDQAKEEAKESKDQGKESKKGKKSKEAKKAKKEDGGEDKDGKGAKNIRLKRRQGLGVLNGTPAPKKMGSKKAKASEEEEKEKQTDQKDEGEKEEKRKRQRVACRIPTPRKATRATAKAQ